jgi:hypothetical protein
MPHYILLVLPNIFSGQLSYRVLHALMYQYTGIPLPSSVYGTSLSIFYVRLILPAHALRVSVVAPFDKLNFAQSAIIFNLLFLTAQYNAAVAVDNVCTSAMQELPVAKGLSTGAIGLCLKLSGVRL